jgi:putative glutamine amidotransferase
MVITNKFILFSPQVIEHDFSPSFAISSSLIEYIFAAGFTPLILPFCKDLSDRELANLLEKYIQNADGIILQGGKDINLNLLDVRDKFEYNLVQIAIKYKKPIFGICRGMQMINVSLGGSLIDDLGHLNIRHVGTKVEVESYKHVGVDLASNRDMHKLFFEIDAELKARFPDVYDVNSVHHQCIDKLGQGLKVQATSDDGITEVISNLRQNILGVQFHPEFDLNNQFYREIIDFWIERIT